MGQYFGAYVGFLMYSAAVPALLPHIRNTCAQETTPKSQANAGRQPTTLESIAGIHSKIRNEKTNSVQFHASRTPQPISTILF